VNMGSMVPRKGRGKEVREMKTCATPLIALAALATATLLGLILVLVA